MESQKMENSHMAEHMHACSCDMHGGMGMMGGFRRFMVLRLILLVVIIAIAFGLGMKIGEFKGMYGYDRMNYGYHERGMMYMQPGMGVMPMTGTTQTMPAASAGTTSTGTTTITK